MIAHVLKLVWNRKKTNLLIVAEILFSFLVVFGLTTSALHFWTQFRDPLGFDYRDVWRVDVMRNARDWTDDDAATMQRLLTALRSMDGVLSAAAASTAPYKNSISITSYEIDKRDIDVEVAFVTPGFEDVLGLELTAGRWMRDEDAALDHGSVVIDSDAAVLAFGEGIDPLGKHLSEEDPELRVVGVVSEFRRGGEFKRGETPDAYVFVPARLDRPDARPIHTLLIKLAPGTSAAFEEPMLRELQAIAHSWSFNVVSVENSRDEFLRATLIPLAAVGLVAGFLLIMVVLGLTGVMWQNVTRRTREIGLRRATGAHRGLIHRQIVAEVMVTAALGLVVGALLAIQVPLIGPLGFLSFTIVVSSIVISAVTILLLAAVCGLYPGWSATRIEPAEALHYE